MNGEIDRRKLHDYFTEVVGQWLCALEFDHENPNGAQTASDVMRRNTGWLQRYRTESTFKAKVTSVVVMLDRAVDLASGMYDDPEPFESMAQAIANSGMPLTASQIAALMTGTPDPK